MTNLTFIDIKDVSSNKDKIYSAKQDYSSIDKNDFLKVFENANKANFPNQDYSGQTFSKEYNATDSKSFTPENPVVKDYLTSSTTQTEYKRNNPETEDAGLASNNSNQNNTHINNDKQEHSNKNKVDQKKEEPVKDHSKQVKDDSQNLKTKEKQHTDNKSEKQVLEKENIEVTKNQKPKDKKVSEQTKNEIKPDPEKELLQTRIQLATTVSINITGNKNNEPVNKSENKPGQNDSKESLYVKVNVNQAHERIKITQQLDQNSKLKIKVDSFQQPENAASHKTDNKISDNLTLPKTDVKLPDNSAKPVKEDALSDKKTKAASQAQENAKLNNKPIDTDDLKNKKKVEVLVQNDHPEIAAGVKQEQKQPSINQKNLSEIISKNSVDKPVVTKLEIQNNSNGTSSDPKQKQNLMEEQSSKLASQLVQTGDANISITTTTDKAIIFDKILESSQETKINSDSVLKQVSEKVSSEFKAGKSEITMSLRPESLGKVDINIVSEKGVITAQIITENSQVKDALNKEIDVLKQKLQDQGVNLDKVAVKVQEPAQTNNNHSNFDQDSQKFNQSNQNASTDFNSGKHTQEQTGTKQANYDSSDFNAETDPDTDTENLTSEVHNGMIDYRI